MSGGVSAGTILAGAVAANTVYGIATGETGGLVGELFGVQDSIDSKTNQAKQDAADRQAALQKQVAAGNTAQEAASAQIASLISNPPATATVVAPPPVEKPTAMPSVSQTMQTARRVSIVEQRKRQGRASTILTDTLGGG